MNKINRENYLNYYIIFITCFALLWFIMENLNEYSRTIYIVLIILSSYIPVQLNSTQFIPHFFLKNKKLLCYVFIQILGIGFISLVVAVCLKKWDINNKGVSFEQIYRDIFMGYTFCISMGSLILFSKNWPVMHARLIEMENQRAKMELNLIRTQINPHFLLNTLNNIHALILQKSDNASTILMGLSDMLKYSLYQTNTTYVSLDKEISFIQNYIKIQRIRTSNIEITQEYTFEKDTYLIAPYLLIIFIENAFKHGVSSGVENPYIHIYIKVENNVLTYQSDNNYINNSSETNNPESGFGLESAKKILELIYPSNYELLTKKDRTIYRTKLTMNV